MRFHVFATILAVLASGTAVAGLCLWLRERGMRPLAQLAAAWQDWSGGSRLRKALSLVALAALVSWAGTKPEGAGEIIELSNNRIIESADGAGLSSVGRDVLDAPQDNDSHGATEARSGSGGGVSDRINRIDRIDPPSLRASVSPCEETFLAADETSLSNHVNPVNPVEKNDLLLVRVGTNEVFDFSVPDGATVAEKWRRRGASRDYLRLNFADWSFPFGDESFSNLVVFAGGRIRLSCDAALCPFAANLGIVPEARWPLAYNFTRRSAEIPIPAA